MPLSPLERQALTTALDHLNQLHVSDVMSGAARQVLDAAAKLGLPDDQVRTLSNAVYGPTPARDTFGEHRGAAVNWLAAVLSETK